MEGEVYQTSIEDCVELAVKGLECFGKKRRKRRDCKIGRRKLYFRQTKEVRSEQSWVWLQNGDLKRETESLIVAAQNQSVRTNLVKAKIDKSQKYTLCRLLRKLMKV